MIAYCCVDTHIVSFCASVCEVEIVSDTEGGFVVERAVDIANAAVQHIRTVSKTSDEEG